MRFLIPILTLLLLSTAGAAQQRTIKGRLITVEEGTPMPGLTVLEQGTSNATVTDINGEFTLIVNSSPTIIWLPQCFEQLYVEYAPDVAFREIIFDDIKGQVYKDSKKIERKLLKSRPSKN